ncbi:MAG TPA: UDP-N-acetylmuramoyl-L-alanine--D-glutamate ligase [bacterium]|nr:UDP-N-acetylmuramoyl-L-alanine--D-glutamate ligase [bacterium]HPN32353.1 UDP-N-acetylmuramoyl-L-alanine--D-glutamate ligase [bacterium]
MEKIKRKKISVLGICKSGVYASTLLKKYDNEIYLSDISEKNLSEYKDTLEKNRIKYETGRHNMEIICDSDIVVVSPGIPESAEVMRKIRAKKKYVIGEIEAAFRFCDKPVIAVTGSNGKTTVTSLIGKIIETAGHKPIVCGNIGYPFSRAILENPDYDCVVLELSSFQIDAIDKFRPDICVITNITPNHLDRYESFDHYVLSKKNIFKNQKKENFAILNFNDAAVLKISFGASANKIYFNCANGFFLTDGNIVLNREGKLTHIIKTSELKIFGGHNYENVMAASAAALQFGVKTDKLREALKSFEGVEHRIEFVEEVNGKKFYNDSKATSADSVIKSLEAFDCKIVLIAGGRDKNSDYRVLKDLIKKKVRKLVLTGEAAEKINSQINIPEITAVEKDFEKAVKTAYESAESGDAVLLSPACSSYDRFLNFEERGKFFKNAVRGLKTK